MKGSLRNAIYGYVDNVKNPAGLMNGWLLNRVGWDADLRKVEGLRKCFLRRLYREGAPAAEECFARYRREAIRKRPPGTKPPKMLTGAEAKEIFGRYLDKITNPIAKVHFGILMNKAVGGKKEIAYECMIWTERTKSDILKIKI